MTERRRSWLQWLLWLLVALWSGVAFLFSAQNANDSGRLSEQVIRWLLSHFDRGFLAMSAKEQLLRIGEWTFAVRKLAHFLLYTVLGLLVLGAFSAGPLSRWALLETLGLGGFLALLDEVHQSFVPGRSCELRDVAIDTSGVLLGALVLSLLLWLVKRRRQRK